jgi:hypothetical protein
MRRDVEKLMQEIDDVPPAPPGPARREQCAEMVGRFEAAVWRQAALKVRTIRGYAKHDRQLAEYFDRRANEAEGKR